MGRAPCCQKIGLKKGRWTAEEDEILIKYIQDNGEGSWRSLPKNAGLLRCGKSCRLRWINYLRTDLKRGNISPQEEDLIIKLHATLGNRWSLIASQLSGRTDNEIKNHWNSHLRRSIDAWRRPVNDTLPQHILDNLAKLMAKPSPSTLKETKKNAPKIKDTEKNPTTDESIFSLEDQQDLADVASDYGGVPLLNEMVSHLGQLLMPQSHATTEILTLNLNPGAINLELMNDLTDLGPSHAETGSSLVPTRSSTTDTTEPSLSSPYTFDQLMNMSDEWSWEDYTQPAGQDLMNHEVGRFMSWSLDFDDVGSWDCQNG